MRTKTHYAYTNSGITIYNLKTGEPHFIDKSHGAYDKVIEVIHDDDLTYETIQKGFEKVAEEVFNEDIFDEENGSVNIGGHVIKNFLVEKWIEIRREGGDTQPFLNFIERLEQNPSAQSVTELTDFLAHSGFPITEDGYFLAYKGVKRNLYSKHGNTATKVISGKVNSEGQIYNGIGDVIEISRNSCDDNRNIGCSYGIHVGTFNYANSWGDKMVLVKVDPKDVVSVPHDCSYQKLRCCKYEVMAHYNTSEGKIDHTYAEVDDDGDVVEWEGDDESHDLVSLVSNVIIDKWSRYPIDIGISHLITTLEEQYDVEVNHTQIVDAIKTAGFNISENLVHVLYKH